MAEAKTKTKKRRTEKEKAQDQHALAVRKLERVQERRVKVEAQLKSIVDEERELTASADFWGSHPLLQEDAPKA